MNPLLENAMQHWNMVAPAIATPTNKQDYLQLMENLREAIVIVENRTKSPLKGLIAAMGEAAKKWEDEHMDAFEGDGLTALKYLIKLHSVRQTELKEIGSQGVVSEVLNGKRALTLRHVRELASRFNVSPNVFIKE